MGIYKLKYIVLLLLVVFNVYASDASVKIITESETTAVGERFRVEISAEGSYKTFDEPTFKNFAVENRSQSTSTSISIINGKMERTKSISYTYVLSAIKSGAFTIGPAFLELKDGKKIKSNTVSITVLDTPSIGSSKGTGKDRESYKDESEDGATDSLNALEAPLTSWEKRTPGFFIRSIVGTGGEQEEFYEGEPITISYYIFTKPGAISNIVNYEVPEFENSWKEETTQSRLNFRRTVIEKQPYDYSLIKTFVLIPEKGVEVLRGTQMVVELTTGSFFNVRKHTISSPAVSIPLDPLPDSDAVPNGFFGDFKVTVDKKEIVLDSKNLLDSVTYTLSGCGNIHNVNIDVEKISGVQLFPPDIKTEASVVNGKYCGTKQFNFMLKGIKKGQHSIQARELNLFNREKGWHKIKIPSVKLDIREVTAVSSNSSGENGIKYEVLRELPSGITIYNIDLITEKIWFRIALAVPFFIILGSLLLWLIRGTTRKISMSFASKLKVWEEKCADAKDSNELMNIVFEALSNLYSIELRGERKANIEKKYGQSLNDARELIKELQYSTYSGNNNIDLDTFKKRAIKLLNPGVYKK